MQVKQQCYILGGSVIVPGSIVFFGFNYMSALLGVVFYLGFLVYSLQRGEPTRSDDDKVEDVEAVSTQSYPSTNATRALTKALRS